ncbi:GMC oxidoreductase [Achromobacter xylosoxidans]
MYRENGRVVIPEHGFTPLFNISRPKSRGWLKIQSADPTQHPRIQPNYFSDPDDIRVYREGIRIGREVLAQRRSTPIEAWSMPPARRPRPMPRSTST